MKLKRYLLSIILMVLFFDMSEVNAAATTSSMLCVDGYSYYIEMSQPYEFSNLIGKSASQLGITIGKMNGTSSYNGVRFNYSLNGYFYGESSKLNNRCYTYVTTSNPNITQGANGSTITSQQSSYTLKQCGNNYDIKLNFERNVNLSNSLITEITDNQQVNADYLDLYSNNIIGSDGKVTLIVRPSANSKLVNVWDRIGVSTVYNGTADYGRTGKGNCTVHNGNTLNDKYIKCTNISPHHVITDGTGKVLNDSIYKIYIYLNGIKTTDFGENVSATVKSSYVNSCGGANGSIYLGYITTNIVSEGALAVPNPALSNNNLRNLCSQLNSIDADQRLKETYVEECYDSKISYVDSLDLGKIQSIISTKVDNLLKMFETIPDDYIGLADVEKNGELLCTDRRMGIPALDSINNSVSMPFESKVVYEKYGVYWGMVCVEDYYVDGGVPSLVKAGTGVEYNNKVQIDKTCTLIQLKTVQRKPSCSTSSDCNIYFDHGNDGVVNNADTNGGPSDNFDSCIKACDGGKYTQKCINSCYSSTYSNERANLLTNSTLANQKFSNLYKSIPVTTYYNTSNAVLSLPSNWTGEDDTLPGGFKLVIEPGGYQEDTDGNGALDYNCMDSSACRNASIYDSDGNLVHEAGTSVACDANIYVLCNTYSGPPGCSNNADQEYNTEIGKSRQELSDFEKLAKQYSQLEGYSISFTDSANGNIYKVSGNTKNEVTNSPQLIIKLNDELTDSELNNVTYTLGSQGDSQVGLSTSKVSTVYDIELPLAQSKIDNAEVVVVENPNVTSDTNRFFSYSMKKNVNPTEYTFEQYSNYDASLFTEGKNVYYTNLHSPLYNVLVNSGKTEEELSKIDHAIIVANNKTYVYELVKNSTNIKVDLKVGNFGENDFVSFDPSGFNCYYGVHDFLFDPDNIDDEVEPSPTPTPYISLSKNGLRYYYREIYLNGEKTDGTGGIFPNRNPRSNWIGTIKNGVASGSANNDDPSYIVDPEKLIKDIEAKGDSVFTNQSEYDYVFVMTPEIINQIRDYNKTKIDGRKITYLDFSLVASSRDKSNYSEVITKWYSNLSPSVLVEISGCNNAKNGGC